MNILNTLTNRPLRFMMNALCGVSSMMILLIAAPATATATATGQSGSLAHLYAGTGEAVYLIDSCSDCDTSIISRVFFDDVKKEVTRKVLSDDGFRAVYSMGLTPDGKKLTMIDEQDSRIGFFDIETGDFTDTGKFVHLENGDVVPDIVLGGFPPISPSMALYGIAGSEETDELYEVTPSNGVAKPLGHVYVMEGDVELGILDLQGADLAFDRAGNMFLWTNKLNGAMHKGLYQVTFDQTKNRLEGRHLHSDQAEQIFLTGLAFRFNGRPGPGGERELVGSVNGEAWVQVFGIKAGSDALQDTVEYPYSSGHEHIYGDMASAVGQIGTLPCTYSKGYWKNHPWEYTEGSGFPGSVQLCKQNITESDGKKILRSAKNRNFSMLTAQLIAAKLNAGASAAGTPIMDVIREAEAFLCEQTNPEDKRRWSKQFNREIIDGLTQKQWATDYKDDLVYFNEGYIEGLDHCD